MGRAQATGIVYAAGATVFFATSPVLVKLAEGTPPAVISFARMLLGGIIVAGLARVRRQELRLRREEFGRFACYGLVTALHFLLYISSLFYTTIARALSLVYTAPAFVAIISRVFLGETVSLGQVAGMCLTIAGIGLLAGFEPTMRPSMLLGDCLAILSAICFAIYTVLGRAVKDRYPLFKYTALVYLTAAVFLLPAAVVARPTVVSARSVLAMFLLALIPTALGHTLYNAALRRMPSTYVNILSTQEVTGGIVLGYLVLGETPTGASLLGCAVTLCGVLLVLILARPPSAAPPS